jgi:RNA polymerase sigma-70 factor (ECF subfamily)
MSTKADVMSPSERDACFESWVQDHIAILYRVANAFATGPDRHDLLQELLLAVWRSVPEFRADSKPSTFMYRVSHNAALTWKRRQRNYRRKVEQFASLMAREAPNASTRQQDALERTYAAIRELPELDRSLILLHLDGLSYREAAEIHGLSETNVGARLTRIRARLAKSLQET